jgi:ribose transport system substrate-binding protein
MPGAEAVHHIRSQLLGKAGQIKVFTYDATPEVVQGIVAGTITAAVAQDPSKLGAEAVRIAVDAVNAKAGGAVTRTNSKNVLLPLKVLTPENIDTPEAKRYFYYPRCR